MQAHLESGTLGERRSVKRISSTTWGSCVLCSPPPSIGRVFSRDVVLGGGGGGGELLLWGEKNVKNIQKTSEICYCLGGKFKT